MSKSNFKFTLNHFCLLIPLLFLLPRLRFVFDRRPFLFSPPFSPRNTLVDFNCRGYRLKLQGKGNKMRAALSIRENGCRFWGYYLPTEAMSILIGGLIVELTVAFLIFDCPIDLIRAFRFWESCSSL